jgi:hypothetical protein
MYEQKMKARSTDGAGNAAPSISAFLSVGSLGAGIALGANDSEAR